MKTLKYQTYELKYKDFPLGYNLIKNVNALPHDYSKDYLTFEALEDGTFTLTLNNKLNTNCVESVSYSIDNGNTWNTTNNIDGESVTIVTPEIPAGNKVLWKGTAIQYHSNPGSGPGSNTGEVKLISTGRFNISGNIMSLLYGDEFIDNYRLPDLIVTGYLTGNFTKVFSGVDCKIISAKNLILPATTLIENCYNRMFYGCTSLVTAPELPATTLASGCYSGMFENCTSLVTAPKLPATTLVPACYPSMFYGCTSLVTAPELPATTLTNSYSCYSDMFTNCISLNYIKAMFITTPSEGAYTDGWVSGVSPTGTFVKNSAATWNVAGDSGIPTGWTVETADVTN